MGWMQSDGILALVIMAIAVGLDGFSVSLGIGLQEIRLKRIAFIGIVMGVFHFILPLIGVAIGHFLSVRLHYITTFLSGIILVFIGCYIIFSTFRKKRSNLLNPYHFQIISLAFIVSLDSFSIGLSLGLSGIKTMMVTVFFGVTATLFSWTGMLVGRRVHQILGIYSEVLGGSILCLFGLHILF